MAILDPNEKHSADGINLSKEDLETLFESAFDETKNSSQNKLQKKPSKTPFFEPNLTPQFLTKKERKELQQEKENLPKALPTQEQGRGKSSLRMKYEAEVEVIKKTQGDLEDIRRKIGLSKRKMAQLLLVDPSAWTRWTSKEGKVPPHIYRSLQWYLILQDKHPELKSSLWLNSVAQPQLSQHEIENIKKTVRRDLSFDSSTQESLDEMDELIKNLKRQLSLSNKQVQNLTSRLKQFIFIQSTAVMIIALLLYWF